MKQFDYSEHTTNSLQALYEELRNVVNQQRVDSPDYWQQAKAIEVEFLKRNVAFDKIQWKETVG